MSWEQPPRPGSVRRRLGLVVVAVLVASGALVALRTNRAGTLTVAPSPAPSAAPSMAAAFRPVALDALRTADTQEGDGPLLPHADGMTIVAADETRLHVIDVDTGAVRTVRLPEELAPVPQPSTLFLVGDSLIVSDTDQVIRLAGAELRAFQLATDHRALRTFDDGSVWLVDTESVGVASLATRVGLDGTVLDQVRLPAVARPLLGTAEGLLVWTPSGINVVSSSGARPVAASGDVAAADGERLARLQCAANLSCHVALGTFADPDQVRLPLATADLPGGFFGLPSGEFSPDGRWLALPLYRITSGRALDRTAIAIIDTAAGVEVARARGISARVFDNSPLAWSPDSRWLVLSSGAALRAWSAQQQRFVDLAVDVQFARDLVVR